MKKIVYIFYKLILLAFLTIAVNGCSENNYGVKKMEQEIYDLNITADHVLRIKPNNPEINEVVLKYFKKGESKENVLNKFKKTKAEIYEKKDNKIRVVFRKGEPLFLTGTVLAIIFEFDQDDKMVDITSRYFIQQ